MEMRLVDKAGKDSYMGPSGPQADLIRQAKSIEDVTLMDWWNLTTTDGDLPEDVQANYIDPNAPNHWGIRALKGRWLIPSDAPPGQEPQRVVVVSYQFWQRYHTLRLLARRRVRGKDRKSTRLNSSHANISYAVFCLKKKIHY